jgi:hypothetical protein
VILGFERPRDLEDAGADAAADVPVVAVEAAAEAPAPSQLPPLPNLVLWLTADRGVTKDGSGRVTTWADQSPSRNDFTSPDQAHRPLLRDGALVGKPALHFDAKRGDYLSAPGTPSLRWADGFVIAALLQHAIPASPGEDDVFGYGAVFVKVDVQTPPYPGPSLFANFWTPNDRTSFGGQLDTEHYITNHPYGNDGKPHVLVFRSRGAVIDLRVDGATASRGVPGGGAVTSSAAAFIGAHLVGAEFQQRLQGDVFELVATSAALSDDDVSALERYLREKHGLP